MGLPLWVFVTVFGLNPDSKSKHPLSRLGVIVGLIGLSDLASDVGQRYFSIMLKPLG
jgi:hypothetical protein